jgi:AraC-like DNA-binding protein
MIRSSSESQHPSDRPGVDSGLLASERSPARSRTRPVAVAFVDNVDGYRRSVSGIDIEAVRTGVGIGPNVVSSVGDGRITSTSCQIGFPILTRTTVADDHVLVALMRSAPLGSRWIGLDVRPGMLFGYAPGSEHTAANRPGLVFTFATVAVDELRAQAEQLKVSVDVPAHGEALELPRTPENAKIAELLSTLSDCPPGRNPPPWLMDDLLSAWVSKLAAPPRNRRDHTRGRVESRRIVRECIDYMRSIDRRPAIRELAVVSRVPERRLREAFTSVYDTPPSEFFRDWALMEAHRRLSTAEPPVASVASVAQDVGLVHLGRFASYYRQVHGELPSATLERHRLDVSDAAP